MEKSRKKLPAGWEMKTLGEIAEIKGGKRIPKGCSLEIKPTNYPYIRVSDFNDNGSVDIKDIHYITKEIHSLIKNYTISTNDLYISIAGTIGKTGIIPKVLDGANLTENACKLVLKKDIDNKFVYYFTKSDEFITQAGFNTRVTAMPKLALNRLSTIKILIPPLSEQQRIVAKLDEAFAEIAAAKANIERNLQNCKEVFQCELNAMFANKGKDWKEEKLSKICEVKDGTHDSPKYILKGIPFITQKNIKEDGLNFDNIKYINQIDHDKFYKRSNVTFGDILISMIGANRGMACIVDSNEIFSIKNVGLIKASKNINSHYLLYYLKSNKSISFIKSFSKGGAQEFIGLTELRNFPIITTSQEIQKNIVSRLDKLYFESKQLEQAYQQKLSSLEELKKSILQKAFSGELK